MALRTSLRQWRWPLIAITALATLLTASVMVTLPLRDSDKADAARLLVAWIVENKTLPGYWKPDPQYEFLRSKKHFYVVCDFLPESESLSSDPRVQRIRSNAPAEDLHSTDTGDAAYLQIEPTSETGTALEWDFSNVFGSLGGHGYHFHLRRTVWGLWVTGRRTWVS